MPSYAFLQTPVTCPVCSAEVVDELWFQWGYCGGRGPRPESTYGLGESIRWARCPDGSIPAWTYFVDDDGTDGGNFGTPDIRDLIARDSGQVWLREPCPTCGADLDGGALEIRGGRIARAWLAVPGELARDSDYWERTDQGLRPLPFDGDEHMAVSEYRASVRRS